MMKKSLILTMLCLLCGFAQAKLVKFSVHMNGEVIDTNGVYIAGDFQSEIGIAADWTPGVTQMTNIPGTEIYSVVVDVPAFTKYEFKFFNGMFGYDVEFVPMESRVDFVANDNRWIYVDSLDNDTMDLAVIRYSGNAPLGQYLLRFNVDLSQEASIDLTHGVHVMGGWQGYNFTTTRMYSFGSNVYQYIAYIDSTLASSVTDYRFANGNVFNRLETVPAACADAGNNRTLYVTRDTVLPTVCFASCAACTPASLSELQRPALRVWPNPASTSFNVMNEGEIRAMALFDMNGRKVADIPVTAGPVQVERKGLPAGIYLLRAESDSGPASPCRIVFE